MLNLIVKNGVPSLLNNLDNNVQLIQGQVFPKLARYAEAQLQSPWWAG